MLVQSTREHRKQLKANKDTKQYGTHYPTQRPGNINVEENLSMESEATKYTEPRCERDNQVTRTKVMEDSALPLNHETLQRHTVRNKPVAAPLSTQHTAYPQHLRHTGHCADPGCCEMPFSAAEEHGGEIFAGVKQILLHYFEVSEY